VILVVLSLLVLFVLLAVTFAIVAGQYRRASEVYARKELLGQSPKKQLDTAMYQLLRDTTRPGSVLRYHSLLRDMYGGGDDGFRGSIASASMVNQTGDQFMDIKVNTGDLYMIDSTSTTPDYTLFQITAYYAGRLFTVINGPARGATSRIVGYKYNATDVPPTSTFTVMAMKTPSGVAVTTGALTGKRFLVNGRPFNGTGVGYKTSTPYLGTDDLELNSTGSLRWSNQPSALLPNYSSVPPALGYVDQNGDGDDDDVGDYDDGGSADEGHDAADYQNMFLGLVLPAATGATDIQPSFHRRALVNYYYCRHLDPDPTEHIDFPANRDLLGRIVLRPLPIHHPNFSGSNSAFEFGDRDWTNSTTGITNWTELFLALGNGPWDVDNDGDGIADSVWLDLGFPIQTGEDGRRFKPLFAILCTDLDGRLNVNAHDTTTNVVKRSALAGTANLAGNDGDSNTTNLRPRGQGFGPPDISLGSVFRMYFNNETYRTRSPLYRLLFGRYGNGHPGAPASDLLAQVRFFDHPLNYFSGSGWAFRSPPDLFGEMRMGLSDYGQPQYEQSGRTVNSPFEFGVTLDRAGGATGDTPFTVVELERILRSYDIDVATLPPRLAKIPGLTYPKVDLDGNGSRESYAVQNLNGDYTDVSGQRVDIVDAKDVAIARRILTTRSFDVPSPSVLNADSPNDRKAQIMDIVRSRIVEGVDDDGVEDDFISEWNKWAKDEKAADPSNPDTYFLDVDAFVNRHLRKMLSPDLAMGLRMDLNRPFGNGHDALEFDTDGDGDADTGDGAVDNADETDDNIWSNLTTRTGSGEDYEDIEFHNTNGLDSSGNRITTADSTSKKMARHLFARHLYVLVMSLIDIDPGNPDKDVAREVAQWAVNVVDFRDADSISTCFEYDPNPFNGWLTDGDPRTDETSDSQDNDGDGQDETGNDEDAPDDSQPDDQDFKEMNIGPGDTENRPEGYNRDIVWGCERPELLISSSLAFHDRRTEDLTTDPTGEQVADPESDANNDFDQRLLPRSGFFVELYNPWGGTDTVTTPPGDLYTSSGLRLSKTTPSGGDPVWRLLVMDIVTPGRDTSDVDGDSKTGEYLMKMDPDSYQLDAARGIYFANPSGLPAGDEHGARRFYTTGNYVIPPGRHAVVGSAEQAISKQVPDPDPSNPGGNVTITEWTTFIGRTTLATDDGSTTPDPANGLMYDSTQRIALAPNSHGVAPVRVYRGGNANESPYTASAVAIPINQPESLTISEPTDGGYDTTGFNTDLAADPLSPPPATVYKEGAFDDHLDEPLDRTEGEYWGILNFDEDGNPVDDDGDGTQDTIAIIKRDGTISGFAVVHLQRLADPTEDWNPMPGHAGYNSNIPVNVYRTVDSAHVNLTCFNGVAHDAQDLLTTGTFEFQCRQRGDGGQQPTHLSGNKIWKHEPQGTLGATTADATHFFPYRLKHTLGAVNENYDVFDNPASEDTTDDGVYAFPWLSWCNRPFVSQYELMQVPRSSSYKLLRDYDFQEKKPADLVRFGVSEFEFVPDQGIKTKADGNPPTVPPTYIDTWPYRNDSDEIAPEFKHLVNFYDTKDNPTDELTHAYRALEFVHVPSRFIGTDTILNPSDFDDTSSATVGFRPPFNRVSKYREPGRVNVNTMMHSAVWDGMLNWEATQPYRPNWTRTDWNPQSNPHLHSGPSAAHLAVSRRGYGDDDDPSIFLFDTYVAGQPLATPPVQTKLPAPTFFANPFRPPGSESLVPLDDLRIDLDDDGQSDNADIHATLLRGYYWDDEIDDPDDTSQRLLVTKRRPLFDSVSSSKYDHAVRSSYFRYENLHRLGNLVTTRSNVFAIWITVGYFEVEPNTEDDSSQSDFGKIKIDDFHPDGFRLGQEVGMETGEVVRHRAFYIIDRTVPVAFQPGQNHNVDKCILLRRLIE